MKKIAEGFTSEIYEVDAEKVLKLYKTAFTSIAKIEYRKMQYLGKFGIEIPNVYEYKVVDDRHGYTMDRINGRALSQVLAEEGVDFSGRIQSFVKLQHKINSIRVDDEDFEKQSSVIASRVSANNHIGENNKKLILGLLEKRQCNNLCHNDFHFNNIIMDDEVCYVIDWNGACAGNCLLDIAKTYVLLKFLPFEVACHRQLATFREDILGRYIDACSKLYDFDKNDFVIYTLIRIAELTSLDIPNKASLLSYFDQNSHLLVESQHAIAPR